MLCLFQKKVLLKKLVCRCYTFYNCEFYLKFSSELAERPISELKFQQNAEEKTTTILDADGQVLVKCRNENFVSCNNFYFTNLLLPF